MRSVFVFLTLLCATKAFAADQYQIIPLYSVANPGRPQVHGALIINETNGDNYTCSAFVHQEPPIGFDSMECSKAVNKVGSMPPGPGALSPFAHQTASPYAAIWKIDQTNGALTFCAATEVPAGGWLCRSCSGPARRPCSTCSTKRCRQSLRRTREVRHLLRTPTPPPLGPGR